MTFCGPVHGERKADAEGVTPGLLRASTRRITMVGAERSPSVVRPFSVCSPSVVRPFSVCCPSVLRLFSVCSPSVVRSAGRPKLVIVVRLPSCRSSRGRFSLSSSQLAFCTSSPLVDPADGLMLQRKS